MHLPFSPIIKEKLQGNLVIVRNTIKNALSAAQSKAGATPRVTLSVDVAGIRVQETPGSSGTSRIRPPVAIRRACEEVAVGTVVVASTQELERPIVKQSGRHETLFHAQQAISLLAPISKEMSSELNINTIVAQGAGANDRIYLKSKMETDRGGDTVSILVAGVGFEPTTFWL